MKLEGTVTNLQENPHTHIKGTCSTIVEQTVKHFHYWMFDCLQVIKQL